MALCPLHLTEMDRLTDWLRCGHMKCGSDNLGLGWEVYVKQLVTCSSNMVFCACVYAPQ